MKVFFTSDMHLYHKNVLYFDHRNFDSVEEMNKELIERWNRKVSPEDVVYVLGDMFWKTGNDQSPEILKNLNGQIVLIKGNHDTFIKNEKAKALLKEVKDYDDICVTLEDGTQRRCILSHFFIPFYNAHHYGAIHLHGHSHVSDEALEELRFAEKMNEKGIKNEIYNVGCMYWNYEPVTLDEILADKERNEKVLKKMRRLNTQPQNVKNTKKEE